MFASVIQMLQGSVQRSKAAVSQDKSLIKDPLTVFQSIHKLGSGEAIMLGTFWQALQIHGENTSAVYLLFWRVRPPAVRFLQPLLVVMPESVCM